MNARRLHQINEAIDIAIREKDFPAVRMLSIERAELERELNRRADLNAARMFVAVQPQHIQLS